MLAVRRVHIVHQVTQVVVRRFRRVTVRAAIRVLQVRYHLLTAAVVLRMPGRQVLIAHPVILRPVILRPVKVRYRVLIQVLRIVVAVIAAVLTPVLPARYHRAIQVRVTAVLPARYQVHIRAARTAVLQVLFRPAIVPAVTAHRHIRVRHIRVVVRRSAVRIRAVAIAVHPIVQARIRVLQVRYPAATAHRRTRRRAVLIRQ